MAKKLITATVENIDVSIDNIIITIPPNTKEYFYIQHKNIGAPGNMTYFADNNTSESIPIVIIQNGEITRTYTVEPHIRKSIKANQGEYIRIPDFKNYEDAIFVEWPKS